MLNRIVQLFKSQKLSLLKASTPPELLVSA
jgi:hypothetical protein